MHKFIKNSFRSFALLVDKFQSKLRFSSKTFGLLHKVCFLQDILVPNYDPILSVTEFHNAKVAGKIGRQLQDPLTLIAGQLPSWVEQLTLAWYINWIFFFISFEF